jgi:hypothetical protein
MKFKSLLFHVIILISVSCVYHDGEMLTGNCTDSNFALTIVSIADVSSCGASDGSITVSAGENTAGLTFSINDGPYQSEPAFNNLTAGAYKLSAKSADGCITTQLASVNNAQSTLTLSVTTTENSGCPAANGTITVLVSGGVEPYQYKIDSGPFQAGNVFTGLGHGDYSITVKDATSCPTATNTTVLRDGPAFSSSVKSIFSTKCAISGCHNGSQSPNLSTYNGIKANAASIKSQVVSKNMPPSNSQAGSLTQDQINLITCWVNDGAPNN